ncbi:MAG: 6-phosphogluconolactonase, partial [Nitrospirae bacterium]
EAAKRFTALAAKVWEEHRSFTVALAGGSTPKALYVVLASEPYRTQVDWSKIEFFFGDERGVPPDHPDSNYRLANESLFRPAGVVSGRIHRMKGEMENLSAAAELYARELQVLASDDFPRFDLVLLGLGTDGHTASLFPHSQALRERTRWVLPILDAPKPPRCRLTLTMPVLNAARQVIFLVSGEKKAKAVREVVTGHGSPRRLPRQARPTRFGSSPVAFGCRGGQFVVIIPARGECCRNISPDHPGPWHDTLYSGAGH